ncbi:MAG TPA: helix-turn-helix domain-containing protein [Nitrospira sp.]|nr:helix-turn-helix domain-containing protein [Nitrospira sp.]
MNGSTLRKRRKQLGMTQVELARALGVAPNTVARYERDECGIPEPVARLVMLIQPKKQDR